MILIYKLYGFQINSSVLLLLKEQEIGRFEQNSQQVWKSISPRFRFKHVHVEEVEEEKLLNTECFVIREGLNEKKTFSFGHCPNYLPPP